MKLTNNFTLEEFTRSNNAQRLNIVNEPNIDQIINLNTLCVRLLQPLRENYGQSFWVSSGYRCPQLNQLIGGAANSQHTKGQAADIGVKEPRKLLESLLNSSLDFDQAILYPSFLHLSYNASNNRKQILYAKGVKA